MKRRSSEVFISAGVEDVLLDRPSFAIIIATIMVQRFLIKRLLGRLQVSPPCRNHHASIDQRQGINPDPTSRYVTNMHHN